MRNLILLTSVVILISCGTTREISKTPKVVGYNLLLNSVEHPANAREKYGDTKIIQVGSDGLTKYRFVDDFINIYWQTTDTEFNFNITNTSSHSIKLLWDDMAYIDEIGKSHKVMHSGVKYIDRNETQLTTTLPRYASITDILIPSDKVRYIQGGLIRGVLSGLSAGIISNGSDWVTDPFFTIEKAKKFEGRSVRVVFPIIIQDVINEYIFEFKVTLVYK